MSISSQPEEHPAGYPFSAIVGQTAMKRALILAAIDPGLGGVLLRGEKGAAKSTAARALALLLPRLKALACCPVGCAPEGPFCPKRRHTARSQPVIEIPTPFVNLPLGSAEDRVLGSLDLEQAVRRGKLTLCTGLLARAHRGLLYIDEVNLLPRHISHLILDAAASGQVFLERDGLSFSHPARFCLIASCNPEEGPLSPQLLDRFGLCVDVVSEKDPSARKTLLKRRLAYEADPESFRAAWADEQTRLRERLFAARLRLNSVRVGDEARNLAALLAQKSRCQGQRGELAALRAARALAAWRGAGEVGKAMVREAAGLALAHRARPELQENKAPAARLKPAPIPEETTQRPKVVRVNPDIEEINTKCVAADERTLYILPPGRVKPIVTKAAAKEGTSLKRTGRRRARQGAQDRGRYLRASPQRLGRSPALDATLRAAAPHQKERRVEGGPALVVKKRDIHEKVRAAKRGRLLLFCVDASGSMNAAARMSTTKTAILGLLTEAYQKRDRVGLVAFGGSGARVLLPPTSSVEVARSMLSELPTGGKTPLAAGLAAISELLGRELAKDPKLTPLVIILTDGRPNVPLKKPEMGGPAGNKGGGWGDGWGDGGYADREVLNLARRMAHDPRPNYVVVDTDTGSVHEINLCQAMAQYMGAKCVSLGELSAKRVLDLVRSNW